MSYKIGCNGFLSQTVYAEQVEFQIKCSELVTYIDRKVESPKRKHALFILKSCQP